MQSFRHFLVRHEARQPALLHAKSVAGALVGIGLVGSLAALTHLPLLMASLGPTAVLIFAQPNNPSSQPINVFGGYFVAAVFAVLAELLFPGIWWAATTAVALAMAIMLWFRITHPPAASVPLVLLGSPMEPVPLFGIMLAGCVVLTALALLMHRLPPRMVYPRRTDDV